MAKKGKTDAELDKIYNPQVPEPFQGKKEFVLDLPEIGRVEVLYKNDFKVFFHFYLKGAVSRDGCLSKTYTFPIVEPYANPEHFATELAKHGYEKEGGNQYRQILEKLAQAEKVRKLRGTQLSLFL